MQRYSQWQLTAVYHLLNTLVQVEKRETFADTARRHTYGPRDTGLGSTGIEQVTIGSGLLEWTEVSPLEVLDELQLELLSRREPAHQHRHIS